MSVAALPIDSVLGATTAETVVKTSSSRPGGMMNFDSANVKIQPGDTIRFVPAGKGHHAELIDGMAPRAPGFRFVMGKAGTATFDEADRYGFKGAPHTITGMVGLIQIGGMPENWEAAKRFEPLAAKVQ